LRLRIEHRANKISVAEALIDDTAKFDPVDRRIDWRPFARVRRYRPEFEEKRESSVNRKPQ